MITDIFVAALTGTNRNLPFSVPDDPDINAFRDILSVDSAKPASYVPLMRVIGAFTFVRDGLRLPVPPPDATPVPSIAFSGSPSAPAPAWTCGNPPTFIHKPAQLPVPTEWALTWTSAATATLTNNSGGVWRIQCHQSQDGTIIPTWPAEVGSNMGAATVPGSWASGAVLTFRVPPCVYPFAYADRLLASRPEIGRLLESAGAYNLHASLLRPAERVAVVSAAVVKRFVSRMVTLSAGVVIPWTPDPRLLAWHGDALMLNNNIFTFDD